MSNRERKGGEGQEVVYFVTCRVGVYYVYVYELLQTKYELLQTKYSTLCKSDTSRNFSD
jgi:hypothetical protein